MITIISVLLSLPKKPGPPEGTSIAQGPPNTGGKGVKKRGEDRVLYSQILLSQKQAIYQSTSFSFTVKTQRLITFEEQWATRAKETGPVQLTGRGRGVSSTQYFGHRIAMV